MQHSNQSGFRCVLSLSVIFFLAACSQNEPSPQQKLFQKKCGTCHSLEPGTHKIGPSLFGVVGRKAGSTDFLKYKALEGADFIWDEEKIAKWITNPKKYIGKPTAMTVKVKSEKDRLSIIDFLIKKGPKTNKH